ncbi:MAG TPA: hypothetical protein VLW53_21370, partial [Candidatus Eisenbacteria bacterium]|nr:hypothetical protein [Candidatus Eisenbacteria bacterium]
FVPGGAGGSIFLFGMAATFAAVALVPTPCPPRTWAWIPAAVLAALAAVTLGTTSAVAAVFWPLLLILGGAYLVLVWTMRGRQPRG